MQIRVASITDRGLNPNRVYNEDSLLIAGELFLVADGLGGELAGEVASKMTVEKFKELFDDATRENGLSAESELKVIERTIKRVNRIVHLEAQKPDYQNMGSTLSVLYLFKNQGLIGHVGDSKIYLIRNQMARQLTHDQSMVQQMIDKGVITPEQARRHPMRNVLLSCIAHKPDIDVHLERTDVAPGDYFFLCSDGVSEYVTPEQLAEIINDYREPAAICDAIRERVLEGGAMDNFTAICLAVDALG